MKSRHIFINFIICLLSLVLVLASYGPLGADQTGDESLDIVISLRDLEENLQIIDDLAGTAGTPQAPSVLLNQMLQGTDWIDPNRTIVLGIEFIDPQPTVVMLVPFSSPNEQFQMVFNAVARADYYLLPLPPGQIVDIQPGVEEALTRASGIKPKTSLSVKVATKELMDKGNTKINELIASIPGDPNAQTPFLSAAETQDMMVKFFDTLSQLESLEIGVDIRGDRFTFASEAKAAVCSDLAQLFVPGDRITHLDTYRPDHQINFRTRSYDFSKMIDLIDQIFGQLYQNIGFDMADVAEILKEFSGEMAGGLTMTADGLDFEGIYVLKDAVKAERFVEDSYLPWIKQFSQKMAKMQEQHLGIKGEPFFVRTEDSEVAGYKVVGVRSQMPMFPLPQDESLDAAALQNLFAYETRMTTVGNLLVFAPNDNQLGQLITIAKTLKPKPTSGPLMIMDVDLEGYFNAFRQLIPESSEFPQMPKMGRLIYRVDVREGRLYTSASMGMQDIKTMVASLSQMAAAMGHSGVVQATAEKRVVKKKEPIKAKPGKAKAAKAKADKKRSQDRQKKADRWFKKGALVATYGNDKAAIQYFQKAITLNPRHSRAYFAQGISYGELGEYKKAIPLIDRAIKMEPKNGIFYYGRGRVHLLSSDKEMAMVDFKKAAALGDEDASNYLDYIGQVQTQ
jgi:tetratricopeptide (TPR) repeat protein